MTNEERERKFREAIAGLSNPRRGEAWEVYRDMEAQIEEQLAAISALLSDDLPADNPSHVNSPVLLRRLDGGWLAVSRPGVRVRIGVVADTANEARIRFTAEMREWIELLLDKA